jgi:magnesium chelatase subunit I
VNERQYHDEVKKVHFTLVGTMNPAEGGLRPQLLDRFGLMADVVTEPEKSVRVAILQAVLDYDAALGQQRDGRPGEALEKVQQAQRQDVAYRTQLVQAKERLESGAITLPCDIAQRCALAGKRVQAEGHRGDYILALAACARAALRGTREVTEEDLKEVAPLALQHRRPGVLQSGSGLWTEEDTKQVIAPVS